MVSDVGYFHKFGYHQIADFLVFSRVLISIYLIITSFGFIFVPDIDLLLVVLMVGWLTDIFDGPIARKGELSKTKFGNLDKLTDYLLLVAGFIVMELLIGLPYLFSIMCYFLLGSTAIHFSITRGTSTMMLMISTAVIYGYLITLYIRRGNVLWVGMVMVILLSLVIDMKTMRLRIKYVLSFGDPDKRYWS